MLRTILNVLMLVISVSAIGLEADYRLWNVTQLDYFSWNKALNGDNYRWYVIVFYDEQCKNSDKYERDFAKLAMDSQLWSKGVKFGAVNARAQRYLTWINKVTATPDILLFRNGDIDNPIRVPSSLEAYEIPGFIKLYV